MKNIIKKIRAWIISKIFTEREKYLIEQAISYRVTHLEKIRVTEKSINAEDIRNDCNDLNNIASLFKNNEHR